MDSIRRTYKIETVRKIVCSCSGDNFPTIKLMTEKEERESKFKVWAFGLRERNQEREKVSLTYERGYIHFYSVVRHE